MSLINDALKRARQAQQKNEPPSASATMRPVEARRAASKSALIPLVLATLLVVIGGILIVIALTRGESRETKTAGANPAPVSNAAKPPAAAKSEEPSSSVETPTSAPTTVAAVTPAPSSTPTQAVAVAAPETNAPAVPTPPVAPPVPKLQGIFFNPSKPSAVVNSKTVYIGSKVGEFSVVDITQRAVALERGGETNVLALEE